MKKKCELKHGKFLDIIGFEILKEQYLVAMGHLALMASEPIKTTSIEEDFPADSMRE